MTRDEIELSAGRLKESRVGQISDAEPDRPRFARASLKPLGLSSNALARALNVTPARVNAQKG